MLVMRVENISWFVRICLIRFRAHMKIFVIFYQLFVSQHWIVRAEVVYLAYFACSVIFARSVIRSWVIDCQAKGQCFGCEH